MYFIQENDKLNFLFKLFSIVEVKEDKIIIPVKKGETLTEKKSIDLAKKIKKILKNTNCNKIVLSKELKKEEILMNYLYSYQIEIADGRWLLEIMLCDIVKTIVESKKMDLADIRISVVVNNVNDNVISNMYLLAKEYKKVNIVTNHIEKFKKIEKNLLENEGIMISVANNKAKSLAKSKIILNIDFPEELLNKYNLFEEAIIVNVQGNVKINKKRFNGTIINDYEIVHLNNQEFDYDKKEKYYSKDIYEAKIYKRQPFEDSIKRIHKDKIEISKLIS